eukprot:752991-Hanusia_phi.AAC.3
MTPTPYAFDFLTSEHQFPQSRPSRRTPPHERSTPPTPDPRPGPFRKVCSERTRRGRSGPTPPPRAARYALLQEERPQ